MDKLSYQKIKTFSLFGKDFFKITEIYTENFAQNAVDETPVIISQDYANDEFNIDKE